MNYLADLKTQSDPKIRSLGFHKILKPFKPILVFKSIISSNFHILYCSKKIMAFVKRHDLCSRSQTQSEPSSH